MDPITSFWMEKQATRSAWKVLDMIENGLAAREKVRWSGKSFPGASPQTHTLLTEPERNLINESTIFSNKLLSKDKMAPGTYMPSGKSIRHQEGFGDLRKAIDDANATHRHVTGNEKDLSPFPLGHRRVMNW